MNRLVLLSYLPGFDTAASGCRQEYESIYLLFIPNSP